LSKINELFQLIKDKKHLALTSTPFVLFTVISASCEILFTRYIIVNLGMSNLGVFALLLSISSLLFNFIETRTNESIVYFLSQKNNKRIVLTTSIIFDVISTIFLSFVVVCGISLVRSSIDGISSISDSYLILGVLINIPLLLSKSLMGFLNFKENFILFNFIAIVPIISKVLIVYTVGPIDIPGIITLVFIINLIYGLFCLLYILFTISFKLKIDKIFFKSFFSFSYKTFLSTMLKSAHENSDKILVNIFLGNTYVGILDILQKILRLSRIFINPISTILLPKLSKDFSRNTKINWKDIFNTSLFLSLIILVVSPLILIAKKPIFMALGLSLDSINNYLLALFLSIGFGKSFSWWVRTLPLAVGKPEISIWTNVMQVFFINAGYVLLIPHFGLYGVGFTLFLMQFITVLFVYHQLKNQ